MPWPAAVTSAFLPASLPAMPRSFRESRRDRPLGIRPVAVGDRRVPPRAPRIAIVRVAAELAIELVVLRELRAVERDPEAVAVGHADRAVRVGHLPAGDHVVDEV